MSSSARNKFLIIHKLSSAALPSYFDRCITGHQWRGVCYELVMSPMTWQEASEYCVDSGGYLVHVDDPETNIFVATMTDEIFEKYVK